MPAGFLLTLTECDGSSQEHKLAPGSYVIGREPDCEIVAPIFDERNAAMEKMFAQVSANFHADEVSDQNAQVSRPFTFLSCACWPKSQNAIPGFRRSN